MTLPSSSGPWCTRFVTIEIFSVYLIIYDPVVEISQAGLGLSSACLCLLSTGVKGTGHVSSVTLLPAAPNTHLVFGCFLLTSLLFYLFRIYSFVVVFETVFHFGD